MKMINFSQTTLYGILCCLIPCAIFLFTRDRRAGNIYKFWTVVFILYPWEHKSSSLFGNKFQLPAEYPYVHALGLFGAFPLEKLAQALQNSSSWRRFFSLD